MPEQKIEPEHIEQMNAVAQLLGNVFEGYGFALLVFEFGGKGRMNYISNAQRADMLTAMKEFISANEFGEQPETKETKQ